MASFCLVSIILFSISQFSEVSAYTKLWHPSESQNSERGRAALPPIIVTSSDFGRRSHRPTFVVDNKPSEDTIETETVSDGTFLSGKRQGSTFPHIIKFPSFNIGFLKNAFFGKTTSGDDSGKPWRNPQYENGPWRQEKKPKPNQEDRIHDDYARIAAGLGKIAGKNDEDIINSKEYKAYSKNKKKIKNHLIKKLKLRRYLQLILRKVYEVEEDDDNDNVPQNNN